MRIFMFIALAFLLFTVSPVVSFASDHSPTEKAALFKADVTVNNVVAIELQTAVCDVGYEATYIMYQKLEIEKPFEKSISQVAKTDLSINRPDMRKTDFKTENTGYKGLPVLSWRC